MEGQTQFVFSSSERNKYSKELDVAIRAVQMACLLCQIVLESLISKTNGQVHPNDDDSPVKIANVLEAISQCNSTSGPVGRFWVLSPVFRTSGFVGVDQYAFSLALIEDGKVVLGVLRCPNYPMKKEWPSYPTSESWERGCLFYARRGSGKAWVQPLLRGEKKLLWTNNARQIQVSSIDDPAFATFCEPVNKANSSHSFTAGLAHSVGLRNQPLCENSMVKYEAIGSGHTVMFMKYTRAGCKEKIWDHAAGGVIIQEAGGVVTDIGGHPLDFSKAVLIALLHSNPPITPHPWPRHNTAVVPSNGLREVATVVAVEVDK
ncbi:hypothetical protein Vadar_007271 [Vaccinium darrowii]|uniref:Uncharacterized protein n=1 Tax=Vaccinium darrowii TaxID=229202 RepID=A0ACB7X8B5_9ERIC|nr:hypothetical protein Vadar_007271 [Vaccinium darrowii]